MPETQTADTIDDPRARAFLTGVAGANFVPPAGTPDYLSVSETPGSQQQRPIRDAVGGYGPEASGIYIPPGGSQPLDIQSGKPIDLTKPGAAAPDYHAQAKSYVAKTMELEGAGRDPNSSAVGGFIDSTWLSLMRKSHPETQGMPDAQVLQLRSDPMLRQQMTAVYGSDNAATLKQAGYEPDNAKLRLAHWFGPGGALRVLGADRNTPMEQIFSPEVIAANRVLAGKTAGDVLQLTADQMNGGGGAANLRQAALGPFNEAASGALGTIVSDIQKRSKEYDDALAEGKDLRKVARAALAKWAIESEHPPKDMHENWSQWSGAAIGLAMLGGFIGKNHTAAINAAGEMLQAANAADVKQYERSYQLWKVHNDNGLKLVELLHGEARDIVEDARKSYDQKVTELATLSTAYQLQQKLDPASLENVEKNLSIYKSRTEIADKQLQKEAVDRAVAAQEADELTKHPEWKGVVPAWRHLEIMGEAEKLGKGQSYKAGTPHEIEVVGPDGKVIRRGAAYSVPGSTGMTWVGGGEVEVPTGGTVNLKSTQQPKSATAMAAQKFWEENPNASAKEFQQFNAEGTRLNRLDADFAAGPEGRNLISLNTVADHIPLFRKYAAALSNGNTQLANAALNEIQRQTGHDEITNFDLAKEFLADEVARVLVPGGAGALADREAMKERLKASMSPAQLAGGADTATNFIKGKLEALRTQYMNGDPKREDFFNTKMLTPGAKELFDKSSSGAVDISKAGLDDLLKIIDQPGLTADQRRQIDERLKALGH